MALLIRLVESQAVSVWLESVIRLRRGRAHGLERAYALAWRR